MSLASETDPKLQVETKHDVDHAEFGHDHDLAHTAADVKHGDHALKVLGDERVELTEEDNARIRRKTDKRILTILIWVYFLQTLDKTVLGYGNVFGLSTDAHLVNSQYSLISTMNAIAQLGWQPFSSYLIVKVPARTLMPILVFGWGVAQACMAASTSFGALVATRFLLGLFEAGCLPLFSILTAQWYRRSEQPIRVAAWYSANGIATMVAAIISFGLGHVNSEHIAGWQLIFIVVGVITCASAPFVWWFLDSDVASARFLDGHEKAMGIERLRANQTGTGSNEFKWTQVWEMAYDPKSYLWLVMALLLNIGASVTNAFGPTLIANFGFDKYVTALLNMPFGFLQFVCILVASYAVQKWRFKSIVLAAFVVPVIAGLGVLYGEGVSSNFNQGAALTGYYLLAFLFGGNPLIVSWMVANTAGQTKKSAIMSLYNAGSSAGNIIGPLLFNAKDKPHYIPGVRAVLGLFCALLAVVGMQVVVLFFLNRQRENQREKNGKPRKIEDTSMSTKYVAYGSGGANGLGQNALLDMTDFRNDEFVYLY
ncbi:major facilitator superfamily domain-containing protein [Naematelia encephala]|uniref:Major facilitator superfamily domain-containing protein n=1 Tax=Naematelia encephala TaxID=71784 RepID=A0A1Y2AM89_9TREE|nr:major facilitator superfamily domain-containing protein [Naematelia encephala]